MSKARNWKGWKKLHFDFDVWHYRIYPHGPVVIRDNSDHKYLVDYRMFDLLFGGHQHVRPAAVKSFVQEWIIDAKPPKFAVGDYVKQTFTTGEVRVGRVYGSNKGFPRAVAVKWNTGHFSSLIDSHKLEVGFPSLLHELADCAE